MSVFSKGLSPRYHFLCCKGKVKQLCLDQLGLNIPSTVYESLLFAPGFLLILTETAATWCITMHIEEYRARATPYQADCRGNGLLRVSFFSLNMPQYR